MKITVRQLKRIIREAVIREAFWNKKKEWTLKWDEDDRGIRVPKSKTFKTLRDLLAFSERRWRKSYEPQHIGQWVRLDLITPRPTYQELLDAGVGVKHSTLLRKEWEDSLNYLDI